MIFKSTLVAAGLLCATAPALAANEALWFLAGQASGQAVGKAQTMPSPVVSAPAGATGQVLIGSSQFRYDDNGTLQICAPGQRLLGGDVRFCRVNLGSSLFPRTEAGRTLGPQAYLSAVNSKAQYLGIAERGDGSVLLFFRDDIESAAPLATHTLPGNK